jgi:hypothetical protein
MAPNVSTNRENLHHFKIKIALTIISDQENISDEREREGTG